MSCSVEEIRESQWAIAKLVPRTRDTLSFVSIKATLAVERIGDSLKSDDWNKKYRSVESEDGLYGREPNDYLAAKVALLSPASKVLCLAEGEGRNALFLAGLGHQVHAVDFSEAAIETINSIAQSKGLHVQTEHADLTSYDLGVEQWDAVISIWCHVPKAIRSRIHRSLSSALRPGGYLILESYRPKQLEYKTGGPPTAELMATVHDLRTELAGLHVLELKEVDRLIHEGVGHRGLSAVVQCVAQRPNQTFQ